MAAAPTPFAPSGSCEPPLCENQVACGFDAKRVKNDADSMMNVVEKRGDSGSDSEDDWNPDPSDFSTTLTPHKVTNWQEPPPRPEHCADAQKAGQEPQGSEFYDDTLDDVDEAWVTLNLRKEKLQPKHRPSKKELKDGEVPHTAGAGAATGSATVLSCPGCFIQLCYQSQRHDLYDHQWRAVEARHVTVDKSKRLQMSDGDQAKFWPVKCSECDTEVAVQDEEEVEG